MDGFQENDRIIVIGATNLFKRLDPALTRPGRFDRVIEIKVPEKQEIQEIFKIYLEKRKHQVSDEKIEHVAQYCKGLSGAEIKNLVNLCAIEASKEAREKGESVFCIEEPLFEAFAFGYIKNFRLKE